MDTTGVITSNASFSSLMSTLNSNLTAGGTIFIQRGTFDIDAPIRITNNNISIRGLDMGKTILRRTISDTDPTLTLSGSSITISSLTVDGNYPTNSSNSFHEIAFGGTGVLCHNVEIKAFNSIAINAAARNVVISDCRITGAKAFGVSAFGVWNDDASAVVEINHCHISNCDLNGVYAGGKTVVSKCYFANNAITAGGQISAGLSAKITRVINCTFDPGGALASGIEMGNGEWLILGNRITGQPHWGIVNNGTPVLPGFIIANNTIKNSVLDAINISGAQQYFTIEGNVCFDDQATQTQRRGVFIQNTMANHYTIKNNVCYNNTIAQIQDNSNGNDKDVSGNFLLPAYEYSL